MKLGIIGHWSEEGIRYVRAKGLSYVEFCYNVGLDVSELAVKVEDIKGWLAKYEVSVASIGRWGAFRLKEDGTVNEEVLAEEKVLIDVCAALGCPVYVTGCNRVEALSFEDNCAAAVVYFEKLIEYGAACGVRIATYNCSWNSFVHNEAAWNLIHANLPALGIKYDPSHCLYHGNPDYLHEIFHWGHRFYHFHLKGTLDIDGFPHRVDDPPVGLDQINWPAVMATLYRVGYNGVLSLEPHSMTWQGALGEWGIDYSINYIRPMIFEG